MRAWATASVFACTLALACNAAADREVVPPRIAEPLPGATFDRVLVRARIDAPGAAGVNINSQGMEDGAHANWRVNNGPPNEGIGTETAGGNLNYSFAVTLVPGKNHLEVGRCSGIDRCGWSPVDVTVAIGAGSPDPAFAATGQVLVDKAGAPLSITPLADGRLLIAADHVPSSTSPLPGLFMLRADATLDKSWGTKGMVLLPDSLSHPRALLRGDGSFDVVALQGTAIYLHYSASGQLDVSLGEAGLQRLVAPSGGSILARAVAATTDGLVLAGEYWPAGGETGPGGTFVASMTLSGVVKLWQATPFVEPSQVTAAAVDSQGRAAWLVDPLQTGPTAATTLRVGSLDGPDSRFGKQGDVPLEQRAPAAAVAWGADGSLVVARLRLSTGTGVAVVYDHFAADGLRDVDGAALPFSTTYANVQPPAPQVSVVAAQQNSFFVAVAETLPLDPLALDTTLQPGSQFAVARLAGSSLDTSFGHGGIARVNSMLLRLPLAFETTADVPSAFCVDAGGALWIAGDSSLATANAAWRLPQAMSLVRLAP